ncbi:peptide-modifying radical SAM enzyme CbpB [Archaeoglobus neptunius]|uniref:peptide-modifying radical SAM enzyme CbpB n=1 Tax=Archaeoglobus neptunius TaxID=2798580 RepID=UPI0019286FD6|nr:peptide-modifying radical SAM enzyme CbpB [Archaeoglobus neptunius]
MLEEIDLGSFKAYLDPNTCFWVIDRSEIAEKLFEKNRDKFLKEMERYRFAINPTTVYINPTEKCNRNCPYCYIPGEIRARGRSFDYETLEDILNRLENVEWVIFHGAEPLIVKDIIFKAIEEFNFKFGIQTNATLLSEEDAEFLMKNNVSVGISFDSHIREVDETTRGEGHYRAVLNALEYFNGYRNLNIIATVNVYNYRHLDGLVDFLAGKVEILLANPVRGTSEGGRELRPPEGFERYYIKAVDRAIEHTREGERIVIGDFANVLLGLFAPTSRVLQCDISPCGAGRRFFAISVDGIYPCGEFIGMDEFRADISMLSNLEEILDIFCPIRERIVEKIPECMDCTFRHLCGSPCPAEIYAEHKTMYAKSPYCEFYKEMVRHAFRVIERGDVEHVLKLENLRKIYEIKK